MTQPRKEPDFVPICKVSDIHPGEGKMVRPAAGRLRNKPMAIFEERGTFYALNYICPHSGGPISEGTIENGIVTCPWHAWSFHAATGLPGGTGGHPTVAYEVKVEGDDILVGWIKPPK